MDENIEAGDLTVVGSSEVEVLEPEVDSAILIGGYEVPPRMLRTFEAYVETSNYKQAARIGGVDISSIKRWRHGPIWRALSQDFLRRHQEDMAIRLAARVDVLADGVIEVADGTDKKDSTANARVQAGRLFLEAGDDPMINRRPNVQIQHNTFNTQGALDINKVRELSREEILEIVSGSVEPGKELLE